MNTPHPFQENSSEGFTTCQFPHPVPYVPQVADQEHIADYLDDGKDLSLDPFWQNTGANDPAEYAYWATRSCGIAAMKSCIEALGGPQHTIQTWVNLALEKNGYLVEQNPGGGSLEIGWKHAILAQICVECGIPAVPRQANPETIVDAIRQGQLVIASVSYEIGTAQPITRRGGHLVTVIGVVLRGNEIDSFILHNPSGRDVSLREYAMIPAARFRAAFSGRVIVIGPGKTNLETGV